MYYSLIVLLPLFGALIAGFGARWTGERMAQIIPSAILVLVAAMSWAGLPGAIEADGEFIRWFRWMESGALAVDWGIRVDTLTGVMLIVVTTVSAIVHVYSIGYMSHDPSKPRFFAYLSLFTFAMLMLVTANNFVQMFFGWEGVGLASYLLIGFWHHKESANAAAMKAFIVNRVGDFGFALGIFGVFAIFGSLDFDVVFEQIPGKVDTTFSFLGYEMGVLNTLGFLLFIGAMGKSAQFFLHTWLPDAMEGPTPVSALIHAATMVTAGVFLVCRMSHLYEYAPAAATFITYIGATTALFAATVGLVQNDIKRIVAYSTCSQLGYMFFAAGVGAYEAAMFHLFTHAFFKALLFLGCGSVIHAMQDEQDIRKMGGLWRMIIPTYVLMMVGTLALTGFPPFAGFFSKDMVIEVAHAAHSTAGTYAFWLGVLVAAMTAFYSWRLVFKVFHGPRNGDPEAYANIHESPPVMLIPMAVLFLGSIIAGAVFYSMFVGDGAHDFWGHSIVHAKENYVLIEKYDEMHNVVHAAHYSPLWVKSLPFFAMLAGTLLAFYMYILHPGVAERARKANPGAYQFLLNKWYFDELYETIFIRPAMALGRFFWKKGDGKTIDGAIDGLSMGVIPAVTALYSRVQSGYMFHYALAMFVGVAALVTFAVTGG